MTKSLQFHAVLLATAFALSGCGQLYDLGTFKGDLQKKKIFNDDPNGSGNPSIDDPDNPGGGPKLPGDPVNPPVTGRIPVDLPVKYMCSNRLTQAQGNVKMSQGLVLYFVNGKQAFKVNATAALLKQNVVEKKKLAFTLDKNQLPDGEYRVGVCDQARANDCADGGMGLIVGGARARVNGGVPELVGTQGIMLVYDSNPNQDSKIKISSKHKGSSTVVADVPDSTTDAEDCDQIASPLMVDLTGEGIHLSSPLAGMRFDIDGDGRTDQISCPDSPNTAFLALPDSRGRVRNIQQLFGNNTRGPDGRRAANGFVALSKYDDTQDGIIDEQDAVYPKLRVWTELNCNGAADAGELYPLSEAGVQLIRLDYLEGLDRDLYGNETRQRSLYQQQGGAYLPIFDIWFRKL